MSVINTNVSALRSTGSLAINTLSMQTSMQRLSTGLRINGASDDAAGLAISQKMTAQIRGLDQAVRNANDGISLLQTAEGDMGAVGAALQRMRELAVQAANGTNSTEDISSIQTEFEAMISEIDRVANNSQFNNLSIGGSTFKFQIGSNNTSNDSISIDIDRFNASTLAVDTHNVAVSGLSGGIAKDTYTDTTDLITDQGAGYLNDGTYTNVALSGGKGAGARADIIVDGGKVTSIKITATGSDYEGGDKLSASAADLGGFDPDPNVTTTDFEFTLEDDPTKTTVDLVSVDAGDAVDSIDGALQTLNTIRAQMGATQNRLAKTVESLTITSTNMSAARSRIQDTDYAKETTNLARTQIIQQAATAMLAQANQQPQSVLALLK